MTSPHVAHTKGGTGGLAVVPLTYEELEQVVAVQTRIFTEFHADLSIIIGEVEDGLSGMDLADRLNEVYGNMSDVTMDMALGPDALRSLVKHSFMGWEGHELQEDGTWILAKETATP